MKKILTQEVECDNKDKNVCQEIFGVYHLHEKPGKS